MLNAIYKQNSSSFVRVVQQSLYGKRQTVELRKKFDDFFAQPEASSTVGLWAVASSRYECSKFGKFPSPPEITEKSSTDFFGNQKLSTYPSRHAISCFWLKWRR